MVYRATNESLKAIVKGLDVSPVDSILAVGGSGDQAFALLEFAGKVTAVDNAPEQIDFMRQRVEALKRRDYWGFFKSNDKAESLVGLRNDKNAFVYDQIEREKLSEERAKRQYFFPDLSDNIKLDRIRANLKHLVITKPESIFDTAQREQGHSKIYLSNALGYHTQTNKDDLRITLEKVAQNLPINGLIYVTNHDELFNDLFGIKSMTLEQAMEFLTSKDPLTAPFLPTSLKLDKDLSSKARENELGAWHPAVYRKVQSE